MQEIHIEIKDSVPFDPGFARYSVMFAPNIESAYSVLNSLNTLHQKKFQFKMFCPQIIKLTESSIAFYLGCLLWATYISKKFINNPKKIDENSYFGKTVTPEDALHEIDYIIFYLKQFEKDCKYYTGKTKDIKPEWSKIIQVYKEFLTINDFLTKAETTADIILPSSLKCPKEDQLDLILQHIEKTLTEGHLEKLFEIKDIIL